MKNAIGNKLEIEEIKALPNGSELYIETKFPEEHVFIGIKKESCIIDNKGEIKWALGADFEALCKAYEWKDSKSLTPIERLYSCIKIYSTVGALDSEFEVFISENPEIDNITELCDLMECEMSYWEA